MSRRVKILVIVVVGVLAAALLYLRVLAKRIFFEDAQRLEQAARTQLSAAALESESGGKQSVTLYFPSTNQGRLVAESRSMPMVVSDNDRIRQVVLALIAGPTQEARRALPPSADVRAVFLTSEGTAYLDLSNSALTGFLPGIESETLAVYSIVNSVAANVPAVKKVKILVQGQEVETLDGHADLTGEFAPDMALAQ
jgi:spore germination protein GerM